MSTCWHGRSDICPICSLISEHHEGAVTKSNGKGKHESKPNRHRQVKSSNIPVKTAERDIQENY